MLIIWIVMLLKIVQKLKEFINQHAETVDIVYIDTNGTPSQLQTKLSKVLKNDDIMRKSLLGKKYFIRLCSSNK